MDTRWDNLNVDDSEMRCFVALPDNTPAGAIVVAQHAGGVDGFVREMTRRFATAGFVAIAPELYHRDASAAPGSMDDAMTMMGRLRDNSIVADCEAAVAHLKSMPEVRGAGIGVTGFCMGGRVAYLMATQSPEVKASVVFWGGNIMTAWGNGPSPFNETAKIQGPMLGLFGEDDGNPSPADVAKIDAEMTRLGKAHEFHNYKGAGHAFMNEGRPSYREDASNDAWAKATAFFSKHLG